MSSKFQVPSSKSENRDQEQAPVEARSVDSALSTQHSAPSAQCWLCLTIAVPHDAAELVASFLTELGSLGVIEGVRDLQQPVSSTTEVQGFFPEDASRTELEDALGQYVREIAELFPGLASAFPQFSVVGNEAWQDRWRDHFPPLEVGKRFLILPPWEPMPEKRDRLPIVIDPSMAFGTGHHATTQGCLEAIELLHDQYGPPHAALDLGTGSGILAIALAMLGVPQLWAADIDPIAIAEAQKNSAVNRVASRIHFSELPTEQLPTPFALVVANLFSSTLVALAPVLSLAVERTGRAILSGIQLDQEQEVLTAYCPPTWRLVTRFPREEWVTLVCQRL